MLLVNCLSHPSSYVAQEVMMDGETGAPGPHDATYYIDLAKSIDDGVSYADTAVFNKDMRMETFVAVLFRRAKLDFTQFYNSIPKLVTELEKEMINNVEVFARLDKHVLDGYSTFITGPIRTQMRRFIQDRECWPHIVCRHRHIFAFPSCYNNCRLPVFHFERVLAVLRAPSLCVWKTVHFSCPREETLFTTRRVYLY